MQMSLSIIEVKSIPQHELIDVNIEAAKRSVSTTFCNLLSYVSSVSIPEQVTLELVFHKYQDSLPRLFITLRSTEQMINVPAANIISSISSYLFNLHFTVKEIDGNDFAEVVCELRSQLSGRIIALAKDEKIITSNISYSGYYYYTDILDSFGTNGTNPSETWNYNALINQLMSCEKAMVAFQLIPTQLSQEEFYALSNLSSELNTTTRGILINNQMVRESAAEAAKRTYTYYTERVSQPIFIGNIIVASEKDDLNGIISAIKSGIQLSSADPIGLMCIDLLNTSQLRYDFFHFPWNVYNELLLNYRNQNIWNGTAYQPTNLIRLPFLYTSNEATAFFRLPIDDGKIQGIHINRAGNDNELIDEKVLSNDNIQFGTLLNSQKKIIGAPVSDFTRHTLIVGTPGSGKTTFAINLLLQFYSKGVPFLAIEPTKTEYRSLIDKIPDLQVFTPGNSSVVPFIINPFIPPKGIRLEQYVPSLMSAFRAAFSMESPLDVIFLRAIRQSYAQYGWKNNSTCEDSDVQPFGLFEFILIFKKIVAESDYKPETKANIETGGTFRLLNLLDQNRYIYDTINTIPIDVLLQKPTVIELNAIADDEQKALIMALLLIGICLFTKSKGSGSGKLNNILMIDEAHVLLDTHTGSSYEQSIAQNTTVKSLQKMIAEIRSFGTGIIIADQVPSKVTNDIVADTDIKVSFRLVEQNERNIFSNSTNMSEQQAQHLARLKRGEAIVYYSNLDSPKIIITPDIRAAKNIRYQISDGEISSKVEFWTKRDDLLIPFYECHVCPQCASCNRCNPLIREKAEYYASHINSSVGASIRDKETLMKYMLRLHELIIKYELQEKIRLPIKELCNCAKIQFIRENLLTSHIMLSRSAITDILNKTILREEKNNV